ncbi:steroid 3-ketoacyl-CoA thiolase, partial [Leptospira santarosai]|nr:steroid 3-ketoacyl-CoA thiolase [Leptospira santarosai]
MFAENGRITAGNASQMSDGASAVLLMSLEKAQQLELKPRAR